MIFPLNDCLRHTANALIFILIYFHEVHYFNGKIYEEKITIKKLPRKVSSKLLISMKDVLGDLIWRLENCPFLCLKKEGIVLYQ